EGALPIGGLQDLERRLQLAADVGHAGVGSLSWSGRHRRPGGLIAVMRARSYPVYDLLRVTLSMSSPSVPSAIAGSPHLYPTSGLLLNGHGDERGAGSPAGVNAAGDP